MNLGDYLNPEKIVLLEGRSKDAAFGELVDAACRSRSDLHRKSVLDAIRKREEMVSTWLVSGVAVPHGRIAGLGRLILAIGLSNSGIPFGTGDPVHLIFLILGDEDRPEEHLVVLAEIARLLRNEDTRNAILAATTTAELYRALQSLSRKVAPEINKRRLTVMILNHALAVADEVRAVALLLHANAFTSAGWLSEIPERGRIVLVLPDGKKDRPEDKGYMHVLVVPFPGLDRMKQVDVSLLFGVSAGLFHSGDRVVSVSGAPGSDFLDTMMVIDVGSEFSPVLPISDDAILGDIAPHVMERVLQIAIDISREGREGRPIGTIFIIGNYEAVLESSRQLVMNPFHGYSDDERSIIDPFLEETIKEFAAIDGAFILRGDGVIMTAGAFLTPRQDGDALPAGLGTRHSAASGITAITDAVAVVVSQSTGAVSVFRSGRRILVLERPRQYMK